MAFFMLKIRSSPRFFPTISMKKPLKMVNCAHFTEKN